MESVNLGLEPSEKPVRNIRTPMNSLIGLIISGGCPLASSDAARSKMQEVPLPVCQQMTDSLSRATVGQWSAKLVSGIFRGYNSCVGGVSERFKETVLKTVVVI